jgi:putative restriction endonuclease
MSDMDSDTAMRLAAFARIRQLTGLRDGLTASDLAPGFQFGGVRIPPTNPQRGIFKPAQMKYLLSIKTVFPNPGGRVWYDDQRDVRGIEEVARGEFAFTPAREGLSRPGPIVVAV